MTIAAFIPKRHKDLTEAYDQLLRYRDAQERPPLLLCCDLDRMLASAHSAGLRRL